MLSTESLDCLIRGLRNRATTARNAYNLNVVGIIGIIFGLVSIFLWGARMTQIVANAGFLPLLTSSIVRIGAVAIGIFGVQIMFSFARYHARLGEHLECVADALELTGGNVDQLATLISGISPINIDFGKGPSSPIEKVLDVVSDLVKKVPDVVR